MNLAIFYATALRLTRPASLFLVALYGIVMPVLASYQCSMQSLGDIFKEVLLGPIVPMIIGYTLVKDEIGNTRSLNNGEYMSLLFTRPLTRTEYVLSKWVICSAFVAMLVLLEFSSFHIAELIQGRTETSLFTTFGITNVVLNSFGATAVIVLLNSFPPKIGVIVFMVVIYGSMIGGNLAEMGLARAQSSFATILFTVITQVCAFIRSCASPSIDTYAVFTALNFSWSPILSYLSNISMFLLIAVLILNKREFFYASE